MRRFGGPNKEMRSISRVDKLWVEDGVGVRPQADRPSQPEPCSDRRERNAYRPVIRRCPSSSFFFSHPAPSLTQSVMVFSLHPLVKRLPPFSINSVCTLLFSSRCYHFRLLHGKLLWKSISNPDWGNTVRPPKAIKTVQTSCMARSPQICSAENPIPGFQGCKDFCS
jgi:hypothetical protein